MILLKGKPIIDDMKKDLIKRIANLPKIPSLVIFDSNNNKLSSQYYIKSIRKVCEELGVNLIVTSDGNISKYSDYPIDGIIVMQPSSLFLDIIPVEKDLDGVTTKSLGRLMQGGLSYAPCTPKAVIKMLDYYNISIEGKNVVILGRSNTVGNPLSQMLMRRNASVTICHSKTPLSNIYSHTCNADIIISAVGKPRFLDWRFLGYKFPVVIDVGINEVNGKICGDVFFEDVKDDVRAITPVPGGVGGVTTMILMETLVERIEKRYKGVN